VVLKKNYRGPEYFVETMLTCLPQGT